jgi:hypothetical protein
MVEPLPLRRSSSCDGVQDTEPLSPLREEGWDGGEKRLMVHPHPNPPPSPEGEGILGRVKPTIVEEPLAFNARAV